MKRIIQWIKNDLFYYRIISCHDDGHTIKILHMNKTAAISILVAAAAFGFWLVLRFAEGM
jgi:hypothetical protein